METIIEKDENRPAGYSMERIYQGAVSPAGFLKS